MNNNRYQHLAEAFNSIISMMLASLRVRGWRGLLDLPNTIIVAIYLRRIGKEFAALIASLSSVDLSTMLPPAGAPAPAVLPAPLPPVADRAAVPARPAAPANGAGRARRRTAVRPAVRPQSAAPLRRTRIPYAARRQAFAPLRRAHDPRDTVGLFVTSRSC